MNTQELLDAKKDIKYDLRTMVRYQHLIEKHFIENEHKFGYRFLSSNLVKYNVEVIVVMDTDCKLPHEIFDLFDFRIDSFYRVTSKPVAM